MPAITGAVTTSGTVTEASASAIKTALEIIDDWDASDHCNIRHLTATDDVVGIGAGTAQIGSVNTFVPNATYATVPDEALAVADNAAGVKFTAFHSDTTQVLWDCQTAQVRVTFDDSAPSATNGHLINPGDSGIWPKALATAARFIRTGGTSAVIHASQMKGA
jgi:hypothetical protein